MLCLKQVVEALLSPETFSPGVRRITQLCNGGTLVRCTFRMEKKSEMLVDGGEIVFLRR